jgi:hypothetical protein
LAGNSNVNKSRKLYLSSHLNTAMKLIVDFFLINDDMELIHILVCVNSPIIYLLNRFIILNMLVTICLMYNSVFTLVRAGNGNSNFSRPVKLQLGKSRQKLNDLKKYNKIQRLKFKVFNVSIKHQQNKNVICQSIWTNA